MHQPHKTSITRNWLYYIKEHLCDYKLNHFGITLSAKLWLSVAWPLLALTWTTSFGFSTSFSLLFTLFPLPELCKYTKQNNPWSQKGKNQSKLNNIISKNYHYFLLLLLNHILGNCGTWGSRTALCQVHCSSLLAFKEFIFSCNIYMLINRLHILVKLMESSWNIFSQVCCEFWRLVGKDIMIGERHEGLEIQVWCLKDTWV